MDLGAANWLLGIKITRDFKAWTISLLQESYIDSILTWFNFIDLKLFATPMDPSIRLLKNQSPKMTEEVSGDSLLSQPLTLTHSVFPCITANCKLQTLRILRHCITPRNLDWSVKWLKLGGELQVTSHSLYLSPLFGCHNHRVYHCSLFHCWYWYIAQDLS